MKNIIIIALVIHLTADALIDGFIKRKREKEYEELEKGYDELLDLIVSHHVYADSMSRFGICKSHELLNSLEAGGTYEITPDSSKRRYWLLVEPDTTEFSNLK